MLTGIISNSYKNRIAALKQLVDNDTYNALIADALTNYNSVKEKIDASPVCTSIRFIFYLLHLLCGVALLLRMIPTGKRHLSSCNSLTVSYLVTTNPFAHNMGQALPSSLQSSGSTKPLASSSI